MCGRTESFCLTAFARDLSNRSRYSGCTIHFSVLSDFCAFAITISGSTRTTIYWRKSTTTINRKDNNFERQVGEKKIDLKKKSLVGSVILLPPRFPFHESSDGEISSRELLRVVRNSRLEVSTQNLRSVWNAELIESDYCLTRFFYFRWMRLHYFRHLLFIDTYQLRVLEAAFLHNLLAFRSRCIPGTPSWIC